jgi:hypothetical protein
VISSQLDCESANEYPIGTVVFNDQNSSGSLHVLTPGPDCTTELLLFENEQVYSGQKSAYWWWIFYVTDSMYVYDLPDIQSSSNYGHSKLGRLNSEIDETWDFNDNLGSITWLLDDASANHMLLVPGQAYTWRTGSHQGSTYYASYSNSMPPFDESIFITHSIWEQPYSSSIPASQTTLWGLGIAGQRFGFSYSPVGKVWQTITNW